MSEARDHGGVNPSADPVPVWTNLHRLYLIYSELEREFALEMGACEELERAEGAGEALERAQAWVAETDDRIHVYQLRQYLQTSPKATGEVLYELLVHYWAKGRHSDSDRDKVDFLAVQYLFERAPSPTPSPGLSFEQVAELLAPVIGPVGGGLSEWLGSLEELIASAHACRSLNELLTARIIEQGREIKNGSGERFFTPGALVAFARFGFLVRQVFFRLMHEDLNRILEGLCALESEGVSTLDCRQAQFSSEEPVSRLRMICQSWKVMFQAEYSSGQPLCILADLRAAVEAALVETARRNPTAANASAAEDESR